MKPTKYLLQYEDDDCFHQAEADEDSATLIFNKNYKVSLIKDGDNYLYKKTKDGKVTIVQIQGSILYDLYELLTVLNIENRNKLVGKLNVFKQME